MTVSTWSRPCAALALMAIAGLASDPALAGLQKKKAKAGEATPADESKVGATDTSGKPAGAPAQEEEPSITQGLHPQEGPKTIDAGHNLTLKLPAGYLFFDKEAANTLMERMGNLRDDDRLGVVVKKDAGWLVVVSYEAEGYVKDDDAAKLDAAEILEAIKEGTEQANKLREERGFSAVHVVGWTEPPRYEKPVHHLVWGIKGSSKEGDSVNFKTRVLGRYGYASLNLIDDPASIEASKLEAQKLLAATTFNNGARYEDFDEKKDKVAEYGLAALVAGGAGALALKAAKVGIIAKLLAKVVVFKKLLILPLLGLGLLFKKLFGRKAEGPASPAPPAP